MRHSRGLYNVCDHHVATPNKERSAGPGWGRGPALWALEREMIEAILGHGLTGITDEALAYASSHERTNFVVRVQLAARGRHNYSEARSLSTLFAWSIL